MTQLRQRMLEELQRRNYASGTIRLYIQHVAAFAQHFHRSPDQLGAEEIRQYQVFLIDKNKLKLARPILCMKIGSISAAHLKLLRFVRETTRLALVSSGEMA